MKDEELIEIATKLQAMFTYAKVCAQKYANIMFNCRKLLSGFTIKCDQQANAYHNALKDMASTIKQYQILIDMRMDNICKKSEKLTKDKGYLLYADLENFAILDDVMDICMSCRDDGTIINDNKVLVSMPESCLETLIKGNPWMVEQIEVFGCKPNTNKARA